jgi:LPS O-antigen subunit length determinant protein (WzzB/FepE family)
MKKNNPNNHLQEDEIDLIKIFKLLINSKTLIIIITLVITTLGSIYSFQRPTIYQSTALIEIGQYDTLEEENILLESPKELIQNLNIVFIHKTNDNKSLFIQEIESKLIKIEMRQPSIELATKKLNEVITHIENRHSNLLQKLINELKYKIKSLNKQIEYHVTFWLNTNTNKSLNQLKIINNILPNIDLQIKELNRIIIEDQNNLKLLESNPEALIQRAAQSPTLNQIIYSYASKLLELKAEKTTLLETKNNLEIQLKLMESNDLEYDDILKLSDDYLQTEEILKLSQVEIPHKDSFELELEFLMQQNPIKTQLIGKIVTIDAGIKKGSIIFVSFILGLFLSIVIVLINKTLKAFTED